MADHAISNVPALVKFYLNTPNTRSLADKTKRLYGCVLNGKLIPFCDAHGIDTLDDLSDRIIDYAEYLQTSGLSAHSVQQYLTITKIFTAAMGTAIKHTYKIPRAARQAHDLKHQRRWFNDLDIARCKTYRFPFSHDRNHVLLRLMCETGARVNEIANIKLQDIQLDENTILIDTSKTIPRPVFISQETGIYFKRFLSQTFDFETPGETRVFPGSCQIWRIITDMLQALGLKSSGDGRGPHTFRHYVATDLYFVRGMELTDVAFLLGDTPDTISSRYLHPNADMLRSRMKKASGWS